MSGQEDQEVNRLNRIGAFCACTLLVTVSPAHAASITVTNHSFEDPIVTTIPGWLNSTAGPFCFASACPSIPGWEFSGLGGLFAPNNSVFPVGAVDGSQVFFSDTRGNGDAIAVQSLTDTFYQSGLSYSLTVAVGNRAESFIPFANGEITLFAGTDPSNVVSTLDLSTILAPLSGQFSDVTLFVSAADIEAAGAAGESIGILLGGALIPGASAGQTIFDNVRLSAVPVPAAAWLFGSGLLGLVGVARTRKAA